MFDFSQISQWWDKGTSESLIWRQDAHKLAKWPESKSESESESGGP